MTERVDTERRLAMSDNSSGDRGGIGFVGLLQLLFIGLKLTNHIDWPWWCVLLPLEVCIGVGLILLGLILVLEWMK